MHPFCKSHVRRWPGLCCVFTHSPWPSAIFAASWRDLRRHVLLIVTSALIMTFWLAAQRNACKRPSRHGVSAAESHLVLCFFIPFLHSLFTVATWVQHHAWSWRIGDLLGAHGEQELAYAKWVSITTRESLKTLFPLSWPVCWAFTVSS